MKMKRLHDQFKKEYDFVYQANSEGKTVAGESEAVDYFDEVIVKDKIHLLKGFFEYSGDFIVSDREAAAFTFACDALGLLD